MGNCFMGFLGTLITDNFDLPSARLNSRFMLKHGQLSMMKEITIHPCFIK